MTSPSCTTVKRPGKTSKRPVQNRTEEQQQLPMPPKRQKIEGCGENNAGLESRPSDANGNFPQGQQKQEQTKPTGKVKQQTSIRFQHLYAMAHLCPITITEFKTHTNVDELVSNMCQKLYGDPSTNASAQLKRLYIFFYLKPNSRKSYPLSRLKMLPTCPENLRKKILEIPQLEPECTTHVPILNKVHNQMDPTNACSENTNVNGTLNREGSSKLVNNPLLDRLAGATETGNVSSETQSQHNEIGETNIILPSPNSSSTTIAKKISANRVEILENILIPSNYPRVGSKVPHNRSFHHNDCRSCNLTLNEFQKHSNVLSVVDHSKYGSTKDEAVFNIYQLFLKDDDGILEINPPLSVEVALWKKLAKFKIFCEQCRVKLESKSAESQHVVANEDKVPQPQNTVQPEEILSNQFQHSATTESSVPQPEEILSNQVQHNKETLEISIGNPLILQEVQEQNLAAASQPTEKFNQVQPNLNSSTLRETEDLPLSINQSSPIAAVEKERHGVPPNAALLSLMEAQDMLPSINQFSNSIAAVAKERREEISNVAVPAFIETEDLPSISIQTVAVEKEKQEAVPSAASKAKTKILQEKISEKDTAINSQTFRNQPQDKSEPTFENILNQISINQKWFSEFKSVLLKRINSKLIDSSVPTMPLPLKTFKILSYYHLPVKNILSDFCGNNEELKAFLENDQELFAGLVSLYYNKYFTNPKFRDKYPLRIKSCPSCMQKKMLSFVENRINDKKEAQKGHSVDATTALEKADASNPHNPQSYAISADSLHKPTAIIERNLMNSIPPILVSEEKLRKLNMRLEGGAQCQNRLKIDKNLFPNNNETCEQTVDDDSVLLSQQQEQDHQENSQSTSKDSISTKSVEQNIMKDALQNERIINEDGSQLNHSAVIGGPKTFFTVQIKETTKNNLNIECTKKKGSTVETNSSSTSFRSAAQEHSETSKSNKTSKTITKEGSRTEVSQLSAAAEPKDLTKNSKADNNFLQNKSQTSDQNVSDDTILLSQQQEQPQENSKSTSKDSTSPKSVQQSDIRKDLQNETIISIKASEPKQSTARGRPKSLSALQTKEKTKKSTMVIKSSGTSLSSVATQHCGISKSNRTTKTATKEGTEVKQLSAAADPKDLSKDSNSNMVENVISFDKQNVKQTSKISASQELDANMEQVKATIFKYYTKDYSLPYMLRTSYGLKQKITQMIQDLDFKTFSKITHIYRGAKLFDDTAMLNHIYDYAVKSPGIWSKNLFIKLPDICKLLQANGMGFSEAERIKLLEYISPRFLHWSELKTNTSFVEIVRKNYFKENFQNLNDADEVVKKACSEYYSQCWVLDKWIENVPLVDENILKEVPLSGKETAQSVLKTPPFAKVITKMSENITNTRDKSKSQTTKPKKNVYNRNLINEAEQSTISGPFSSGNKKIPPEPFTIVHCKVASSAALTSSTNVDMENLTLPTDPCTSKPPTECPTVTGNNDMTSVLNPDIMSSPNAITVIASKVVISDILPSNNNEDLKNTTQPTDPRTYSALKKDVVQTTDVTMLPPSTMSIPFEVDKQESAAMENIDDPSSANVTTFTEQQIDLPNTETQMSQTLADPLLAFMETQHTLFEANDAENSNDSVMLVLPNVTIKQENVSEKLLRNIQFELDENDNMTCSRLSEEVVDLDQSSTSTANDEDEALPPSQIDFDIGMICLSNSETMAELEKNVKLNTFAENEALAACQIDFGNETVASPSPLQETQNPMPLSADLLSSGNSSSILNLAQRLPSLCDSNETLSQSQQSQPTVDAVQFIQSLNVNVASSDSQSSSVQATPENKQPSSSSPKERVTILEEGKEDSYIPNAQRLPSILEATIPKASIKPIQISKAANKQRPKKTLASLDKQKKQTKNTKIDQVPQLVHALRALPIKAVNSNAAIDTVTHKESQPSPEETSKSQELVIPNILNEGATNSQTEQPPTDIRESQILFPSSSSQEFVTPDLFNPETTSTQTKQQHANEAEPQVIFSPVDNPHALRVSQELSSDKTLFNNTSLLRLVDHNYHKNFQNAEQTDKAPSVPIATDTLSKVTNDIATQHVPLPQTMPRVIRKDFLYRSLLELHYFQNLTSANVAKYQLPTVNYGEPYMEATILCGGLKTKISNPSLVSLFPQALSSPSSLHKDILTILCDLKEYHFSVFQSSSSSTTDLRIETLNAFFRNASPFFRVQLQYEEHNSEFSLCKSMWKTCNCASHLKKPFQPLTMALTANILKRIKTVKNDLKK